MEVGYNRYERGVVADKYINEIFYVASKLISDRSLLEKIKKEHREAVK